MLETNTKSLAQHLLDEFGAECTVNIFPDSTREIHFHTGTSEDHAKCQSVFDSWDWTPQSVADLKGFERAVLSDEAISTHTKMKLVTLIPLLTANVDNASKLQKVWSDLEAEAFPWLDARTKAIVEDHASRFCLPLVRSTDNATSGAMRKTKNEPEPPRPGFRR